MSHLVALNPPITGSLSVRLYPGFGVLGMNIPTTGENGGSPLLNDGILPDAEYHWRVETLPSTGTLTIYLDGSFLWKSEGAQSGNYPWSYRLYENGIDKGVSTVYQTVQDIET